MKNRCTVKTCVILVGAALQMLAINAICNHFGFNSTDAILAGETPEPGSICLLAMGAIALMRQRRK